MFFLVFLFYLIGTLSGLLSPYFLFLLALPYGYLFLYQKKKDARLLFFLVITLAGFLISYFYPKGDENAKLVTGIVVRSKDNYVLLWTRKGKYYISRKNNNLPLFTILKAKGYSTARKSAHFESGFWFDYYLLSKGVHYEFKAKEVKILFHGFLNRNKIKERASVYLDNDSKAVFSSLRFKDSLSSLSSYASLSELNLANSLSLSGFHLSFFLSFLSFLLGKKREKRARFLSLLIPFLFLVLSGFSYSFRRICLFNLISFLLRKKKRRYLDKLSLTGTIRLILEPYSLTDSSFYYAFPFLFFLAIFQSKKEHGIRSFLRFYRFRTLFYFPYHLYQSYSFSFLSPLFQRLLIPYSHFLFFFSLFVLVLPFSGNLYGYLVKGYLALAKIRSSFKIEVQSGKPLLILVILYYSLFVLFLLFFRYGYKHPMKSAGVALVFSISLFFVPDFLPHQEITFLDVGQGDCTLVRNGRKNLLFDTGGSIKNDLATECLIPYFQKRKIRAIDAVILTHYDYDHAGALESLKQNFKVKEVYDRDDFLSKKNTRTIGGLTIKNLNSYHLSDEENDLSGVYQFTIGKKRVLIRGDAPIQVEKKIRESGEDFHCDYLKVGHHGSKTSSSYEFLKEANPQEAFISVGYKNSYGLPNKEVIDNLVALKIPYHRTDEEGTITRNISFSLL